MRFAMFTMIYETVANSCGHFQHHPLFCVPQRCVRSLRGSRVALDCSGIGLLCAGPVGPSPSDPSGPARASLGSVRAPSGLSVFVPIGTQALVFSLAKRRAPSCMIAIVFFFCVSASMAQTRMTPEHLKWKEVLVEQGAPGQGPRHNALARIMVENCFSDLSHLRCADPPCEWLGAHKFVDGEEDFLARLIAKEKAKARKGVQTASKSSAVPQVFFHPSCL